MPALELSDATIHYEVKGDGPLLVLVPGFASGAWSWQWQVDDLSKRFQVVTFDPRGVANSSLSDGAAVSISLIADDVAALIRELGDSASVLGISFGGFVAQDLVARYPELVERLVLASTSFGGPNHVAPTMEVLTAFASTDGLNTAGRIRKYLSMAFSSDFAAKHADVVDRFCSLREANFVPEGVYMQQLRSAMSFNAEADGAKILAPTLVITGADDTVVPMQNSVNLSAAIAGARLEIIPETGHMAFVERAKEFNRLVTDFLSENI